MKIFAKGEWRSQQGDKVIGSYEIRGEENGSEAEILIYGDIGESWYGESVTAADFVRQLNELNVDYLTVRINSFGGSVGDGLAIYNAIRRHDSVTTVEIDGVAMSAASLIAMAGDTVRMAENGILMIHAPWGLAMGNAVVMREYADILDKYATAMSASYARKTGRPKEDMLVLLTDGKDHFYDAEEALAEKFIDSVSASQDLEEEETARFVAAAFARFNVPQSVAAAAAFQPKENTPMKINNAPAAAAPANPNPNPPATPAADVTQIEQAAAAREQDRIKARNADIRAALKPFLGTDGVQAILDAALDDPKMTLEDARAKVLAKLGEGAAPLVPAGGGHVDVLVDQRDKIKDAVSAALMHRAAVSTKPIDVRGNPYRSHSLLDIARDCLQRAGVDTRGMDKMQIVAAAITQTTSDFPVLLETTMHKTLLAAWATAVDTWSRFCKVGSVSDFRVHPRYRVGSLSNLQSLNEAGEFKNKAIPDGEKASIQAATKGNIISISRQALINDDLGAFIGLAAQMGRAARRTVEQDVYDLLAQNSGLGPTLADGLTLFHANHGNLVASGAGAAPSVVTVEAGRNAMAIQKDISGNEFLDIRPAVWLGPVSLGGTARVVNDSQYDPDTANKLQRPNMVRGLFRDVVDSPRMTGTPWHMFADPNEAPVIEVAFLDGNSEPFLESKDGWNVDGSEHKVRLDFAVGAVDYRGAYRNHGA